MQNPVAICFKIANEAHANQYRWDGMPYMSHINAVWGNLIKTIMQDRLFGLSQREELLAQCAALLHDVVEDCMSAENLREKLDVIDDKEFVDELLGIVAGELTHDTKKHSYGEYIANITSFIGLLVKYSDMQHNMSCSMQSILDNKHILRAAKQMKKYGPVLTIVAQRMLDAR